MHHSAAPRCGCARTGICHFGWRLQSAASTSARQPDTNNFAAVGKIAHLPEIAAALKAKNVSEPTDLYRVFIGQMQVNPPSLIFSGFSAFLCPISAA